ncbi:MAG TPA: hypothetical protein VLX89_09150 [Actinomycetota bacterium]|nr:hypothetical protein [Actinomycetota bacterium]
MAEKRKRLSRGTVRAVAWGAGALTFAIPWAAFRLVPAPRAGAQAQSQQVVVVPPGSRVVVQTGAAGGASGVTVVRSKGTTTVPVATTSGSVPVVR